MVSSYESILDSKTLSMVATPELMIERKPCDPMRKAFPNVGAGMSNGMPSRITNMATGQFRGDLPAKGDRVGVLKCVSQVCD